MKSIIKNNYTILLFSLFAIILIGFTACEEEKAVEPVALEDFKNDLSNLVSSEKQLVQNTKKGYNIGEIYASDSVFAVITGDYLDSLIVAEGIIATPNVTFEDLYYANWVINAPGIRFHDELFIADKRALNDLVGECDTLRSNTPVGDLPGHAPVAADSTFGAAITIAKNVRDDGAGSTTETFKRIQRLVDAEIETLGAAREEYEAAIIK